MTEPKQSFTEFWIIPDSTQLLNNRKHVVYDKEQHDELYFNDGEAYDDYFKPKAIHVIEYSALVAERARNAELEARVRGYELTDNTAKEICKRQAALESENAALKTELAVEKECHEKSAGLAIQRHTEITTLRAQLAKARELYELATRELVKRGATDTDEHEGQEAAVDSWMAEYDLELQKKGQGDASKD